MKFNVKNFKIYIDFSFVALISFVVISGFVNNFILVICATMMHECGHIISMLILNKAPQEIHLYAFDIKIINKERYSQRLIYDIMIIISGPLMNVLAYLLLFTFNRDFAYINLCIGLLNLLPTSMLDGGQLIYLLLIQKYSIDVAIKIVDIITIVISFPLFLLGFIVLLYSKYNFSLLFISIYLVLSVFLKRDKYF